MKNVFVAMLVFFTLTITQAFAYNLKTFTSDSTILAAMELLEQNGEYEVFANLKKNAVKVKFYHLSMSNVYAAFNKILDFSESCERFNAQFRSELEAKNNLLYHFSKIQPDTIFIKDNKD